MKTIWITIIAFFFSILAFPSECEKFHEKNVKPLKIDGIVKKKESNEKFYTIEIENADKTTVVLKLWKNTTTKELFDFIRGTTRIIKKEGSVYTKLVEILPDNNGFNVRHFETLCD